MKIQDELEESYLYNTNRDGDIIIFLRVNFIIKLEEGKGITQSAFIYDPDSVQYFYKTHRSKYYKKFDSKIEVEKYFDRCDVDEFFNKSFARAQHEHFNRHCNFQARHTDRNDPSYNPEDQGQLHKVQMFYWYTRSLGEKILEHYQISRIRFNINTNKWEGIQLEDEGIFEIVPLSEKWVKLNFPDYWKSFLRISEDGMQIFLEVSVGDIIQVEPTMDISKNPQLKYLQSNKDLCVFASLASYLHYHGFIIEAQNLFDMKSKYSAIFKEQPFKILQSVIQIMQSDKNFKSLRTLYEFVKIDKGHDIFLEKMETDEFKIIIICSDDNHMSHAVCINNEFIFDCNSEKCLPMTKAGIDCCCGKKYNFVGIKLGYYFRIRQFKKRQKRNRKHN